MTPAPLRGMAPALPRCTTMCHANVPTTSWRCAPPLDPRCHAAGPNSAATSPGHATLRRPTSAPSQAPLPATGPHHTPHKACGSPAKRTPPCVPLLCAPWLCAPPPLCAPHPCTPQLPVPPQLPTPQFPTTGPVLQPYTTPLNTTHVSLQHL